MTGIEIVSPASLDYLNALFYGEPGAGKTFLCGTAQDHPMTSPVLVLDIEGGTTTLHERKDIDVIQVRSIQQIKQIHDQLSASNDGYYKTVVVDSLTELQKLDMQGIMREVVSRRPDLDPDVPSVREWGITGEHVRKIVRYYRDLKMNTIFTALMEQDKDDTGAVTMYPSISPKRLRTEVPGFLDIVGYIYTETGETGIQRRIQFVQTKKVRAKDRTAKLGEMLENPTIPDMWNLIHPKEKK